MDSEGIKTKEQIKQMIDYTTQNKEDLYVKSSWNLTGIEKNMELMFPENIDIYIENLQQNGLISFEREKINKEDLDAYEKLINEDYKDVKENTEKAISEIDNSEFEVELDVRKGYIEFTELGKGFIKACIQEI